MRRPSDVIPIGRVDDEELEIVVSNCFPRMSSRADGSDHLDESGRLVLQLFYDAESQLREAVAGPQWNEDHARTLEDRVRANFFDEQASAVRRDIVFFRQRVEGYWRYRDIFQLSPVPDGAPVQSQSWGAHPCVLEYRYTKSPEMFVNLLRQQRVTFPIELLLALVAHGGLSRIPRSPARRWVYNDEIVDGALTSVCLQEGYSIPGFDFDGDDFSEFRHTASIASVEPQSYFDRRGIGSEPLDLPANASALFDRFYALEPVDQARFVRALYWHHRSDRTYRESRSVSYVCLINAVEALHESGLPDPCPACNKDRAPGATAHFRTFLEAYASGAGSTKQRSEMYRLRSKLVHGSHLMADDLPNPWGSFRPSHLDEWQKRVRVGEVVRIALLNWLIERQPDGPSWGA